MKKKPKIFKLSKKSYNLFWLLLFACLFELTNLGNFRLFVIGTCTHGVRVSCLLTDWDSQNDNSKLKIPKVQSFGPEKKIKGEKVSEIFLIFDFQKKIQQK